MNKQELVQLTQHLTFCGGLQSLSDAGFQSAYSLDGLQILPPLMTEIKRLEMQHLRMQALAIEAALSRSKHSIVGKKLKCLMPCMVNASTNTALPQVANSTNPNVVPITDPMSSPAPLIVMGRFRQKLQKSETVIHDHCQQTNKPATPVPVKTLPIALASHVVIENAPQRAVITPVVVQLGTLKSSLVAQLDSCEPVSRTTVTATLSTTITELRALHSKERLPGRPVVFPSSTQITIASPKVAQGRFCSMIPTWRHRSMVLPMLAAPPPSVTSPRHAACREPRLVKTDTAIERRRNYGAMVAHKRNEMARKREELAKLKPPPRTSNNGMPKSIRTPIRRVEGGESLEPEVLQQRNRFPSLVSGQDLEEKQQVVKSIRTPIRHVEGGESQVIAPDQQQGSAQTNNNQVVKSIRTPIRRVEGGESQEPAPEQQQQQQGSEQTSNNQVIKSIRTPIRRVEGVESQVITPDQQQGLELTNNQVVKSIRTPIRRVEGAESQESEQQQQKNPYQALLYRQEVEQQRLQDQLEQLQQGLIDQMVGNITSTDNKDKATELVVAPEP